MQPAICSQPSSGNNSELLNPDGFWAMNSKAFYSCQDGFIRQSSMVLTCEVVDGKGEWSGSPPSCRLPTQGLNKS